MNEHGAEGHEAATTRSGGRLDGITKMKGTVSFATGGVSIDFTVDEGNTTGTSTFQATAALGDSIGSDALYKAASLSGNKVTATRLAVASTSSDYTVQIAYSLSGHTGKKKLTGTVPKRRVVIPGSADKITLQ